MKSTGENHVIRTTNLNMSPEYKNVFPGEARNESVFHDDKEQ